LNTADGFPPSHLPYRPRPDGTTSPAGAHLPRPLAVPTGPPSYRRPMALGRPLGLGPLTAAGLVKPGLGPPALCVWGETAAPAARLRPCPPVEPKGRERSLAWMLVLRFASRRTAACGRRARRQQPSAPAPINTDVILGPSPGHGSAAPGGRFPRARRPPRAAPHRGGLAVRPPSAPPDGRPPR